MENSVRYIEVNGRKIGARYPTYVVAEVSANHNQSYDRAARIIEAAVKAGADAIKLQTYTADTMTIDVDSPLFKIEGESLWAGETLYGLYEKAYTPWEWQPKLKQVANDLGVDLFSTPFDTTAADFLDEMGVPAFKIASFECNDPPFVRYVASKGKPILMSTGMANVAEIDRAVTAAREGGAGPGQLLLFNCSSAYPSPPSAMNLRTIPHLSDAFNVPVGLSDHTLGTAVAVAAVALGACAVEKHFTLSRSEPGPDSAFSLEPDELTRMIEEIRTVEQAIGEVSYGPTEFESPNLAFRRSLIATADVEAGEEFTAQNVRSIRPGYGLPPEFIGNVLGRRAARDVERGTPLDWPLIAG